MASIKTRLSTAALASDVDATAVALARVAGLPSIIDPDMNMRGPSRVPSDTASRNATISSVFPPMLRTVVIPYDRNRVIVQSAACTWESIKPGMTHLPSRRSS